MKNPTTRDLKRYARLQKKRFGTPIHETRKAVISDGFQPWIKEGIELSTSSVIDMSFLKRKFPGYNLLALMLPPLYFDPTLTIFEAAVFDKYVMDPRQLAQDSSGRYIPKISFAEYIRTLIPKNSLESWVKKDLIRGDDVIHATSIEELKDGLYRADSKFRETALLVGLAYSHEVNQHFHLTETFEEQIRRMKERDAYQVQRFLPFAVDINQICLQTAPNDYIKIIESTAKARRDLDIHGYNESQLWIDRGSIEDFIERVNSVYQMEILLRHFYPKDKGEQLRVSTTELKHFWERFRGIYISQGDVVMAAALSGYRLEERGNSIFIHKAAYEAAQLLLDRNGAAKNNFFNSRDFRDAFSNDGEVIKWKHLPKSTIKEFLDDQIATS